MLINNKTFKTRIANFKKTHYQTRNNLSICIFSVILSATLVIIGTAQPAFAQRTRVESTEIWLINYEAQKKDPVAATVLSIFPGFGAGHFYSHSTKSGFITAGGQLLGLGLFLLGSAVGESGDNSRTALRAIGSTFFFAFKIGDVTYAPIAAENYNKNLVMRLGIPIKGIDITNEQSYSSQKNSTKSRYYDTKPKLPSVPKVPEVPEPEPAVEPEGFQY